MRRRGVVLLIIAGLGFGFAAGAVRSAVWFERSEQVLSQGAEDFVGKVVSDPREGLYGESLAVLVSTPFKCGRMTVLWPEDPPVPELGQQVAFSAVCELPDEPDRVRKMHQSGVVARAKPWRVEAGSWPGEPWDVVMRWRAESGERVRTLEGSGPAILSAMVLGDRRLLAGTPTEADFRVVGLSHVVAVSGLHLGLICGAVALGARLVGGSRRMTGLVAVVAGALFVIATGAPYSAIRAFVLVVAAAVADGIGVRRDLTGALGGAVVGVVLVDPTAVFSVGFTLSVLAVGGLALFGPLVAAWADAFASGRVGTLVHAMGITGVAQTTTAGVTLPVFGLAPLVGPLANALVLPLIPLALVLGLGGLLVSEAHEPVGMVAIRASCVLLEVCARLAEALAALPGAAIAVSPSPVVVWTAVLFGMTLTWLIWPLPESRGSARGGVVGVVVASMLLASGPIGTPALEVVALDVGQGDAILVRDSGRAMLVDTGPDPAALRRALGSVNVRALDMVVLTHDHSDHTGGLSALEGVVRVGWLGVSGAAESGSGDSTEPPAAILLVRGQSWRLGRTAVRVLWPPAGYEAPCENDRSVVLAVERDGFRALLTGDAESAVGAAVFEGGEKTALTVLKVPHHGSDEGLARDALSAWRPMLAIISVGVGNRFGHPRAETLDELANAGCRILRTDLVGNVEVRAGGKGVTVRTQRRSVDRSVYGRIEHRVATAATLVTDAQEAPRGSNARRGTQDGIPYPRQGGSAARARARAPPRASRQGGRPRLQLRDL
jgi:competence protein ComEC